MKILFLTDNFPPEVNAPASRTYEHCVEWVKQGVDVTIITCNPNFPTGKLFPNYKNRLYNAEQIEGIKVIRVWSYITQNEGLIKRTLDYASFAIVSFFAGIFQSADIIIATSPQFFTAISGHFLSLVKNKPWVMEVRDIWPESIAAVGALKNKFVLGFLEKIELHLYKSCTKVIVVTEAFKRNLIRRNVPQDKIQVIKNGVDLTRFVPTKSTTNLRKSLGLENKFLIGYFGTHGMAHKLDFILDCCAKVSSPEIFFLFIGDGAEKKHLIKQVQELKLTNVLMLPSVAKELVVDYISILDVALVNLKKSKTFETVIPSKIFENAAMLKPLLLGVEGEAKQLVDTYHCGFCFRPEDENDFLNKLNLLFESRHDFVVYREGCTRLAEDFNRTKLAIQMLEILKTILPNNKSIS
ncbi:MAG: glycosyltransferase family 4 protein [Saprospiraceae bacterium]|jgi:glycosyltransferase involved in cell wall biosynthesis|nr:glycosyltransferase family 4 protein [Saprospiraceae bacterium]MBK7794790.1 glycosyltransferase family 4 protein [Saprospiraceae bacterium]MBL0261394.1 glycosyltransferase family 4 protein [Saprospiraceae bacterium]